MRNEKSKGILARRALFRAAGLGVGVLGAVAVGLPVVAEAKDVDDTRQRYRETEHIRKAYETSRF